MCVVCVKVRTACSSLSSLLSLCWSLASLKDQGGPPEEDKTSSWHPSVPIQGRNGVSILSDPGKVQVQGSRNSHQSGVDEPEAGICLLYHLPQRERVGSGVPIQGLDRRDANHLCLDHCHSFSQSSQFPLKPKERSPTPNPTCGRLRPKGKRMTCQSSQRWLREPGLAGRQALPSRLLLMIALPFPRSTINPDS